MKAVISRIRHSGIRVQRGQQTTKLRYRRIQHIDQRTLIDTKLFDLRVRNIDQMFDVSEFQIGKNRGPVDRAIRGQLIAQSVKIRAELFQD